jgi:hypothetical protein
VEALDRAGTARLAAIAVAGTAAVALLTGVPTDIVDTQLFTRMTPVYPDQVAYWIATSVLAGMLIASYFVPGSRSTAAAGFAGGTLGFLAIGCPVCNKLIVTILGIAGAMDYFAPAQPILGAAGVLLLALALALRVRDLRRPACPVSSAAT